MGTITRTDTFADSVAQQSGSASGRSLAHAAAAGRNAAGAGRRRRQRWGPARDALWELLAQHVKADARVAIVGAGNGDDLPLRRLARRAARVDLIDLDAAALRRARRRVRFAHHVHTVREDVTAGAVDAIVQRARGKPMTVALPPPTPIGLSPYDVVISDLLATQLLFPALHDSGLRGPEIDKVLLDDGQALTNSVVARLHAAAPDGLVVHLHDILVWSDRHKQPFPLETVLALAETDLAAAFTLAQHGNVPYGCDPRTASGSVGAKLTQTTFWRWPFAPGTDYLVNATVTRAGP
jgi:SAM-dependent methyltransferase